MAKKKEVVVVEKSKFQTAIDKLNKTYGRGTVLTLNAKAGNYDVISSGSLGFDYITLGIGGFARGKLYELMGWDGSGKSTVCAHAVAECQLAGGNAVYIDGEHAVDKIYFKALGVNLDRLHLAQPSCGEEGFNIAMELIKTDEVDLIIIDSDSSLIPQKTLDGDIGDSAIGRKALLNSNAYPKLKTALAEHHVCVIVVSQYREKIGVMFGNPTTTQGGHALKYYADCRIEITKTLAKEGDVVYGSTTKLKTVKNKMSAPYRICQFEIVFGKGIDKAGEIINLADEYEIIHKWGKDTTYKEVKYPTDEFKSLIEDNDEFFEDLKQSILEKIRNIEPLPVTEEEEEKEEELDPPVEEEVKLIVEPIPLKHETPESY